eukprot:scaffold291_cov168-Amphora_coffeaeformis.AAC.4
MTRATTTTLLLRRTSRLRRSTAAYFSSNVIQGPSLLRTRLDRPNPSLILLPGLRSLPFWTQPTSESNNNNNNHNNHATKNTNRVAYQDPQVTFCVEHLQSQWKTLRDEYTAVAPGLASDYHPQQDNGNSNSNSNSNTTSTSTTTGTEHQQTLHEGTWDWHSYMLKGVVQGHFCAHFPQTTAVLQVLRDEGLLFEGTPFGYSFYSTLHAQSKIEPHTAPMNFRLRIHLPLIVPKVGNDATASTATTTTATAQESNNDNKNNDSNDADDLPCGIRVGPLIRPWVEGQALVLDDAYRHAVWNQTDTARVILLVDIWHPDVTTTERQDIVQMFANVAEQRRHAAVFEG